MHRLLFALLLTLLLPSSATAAALTPQESLKVADDYWGAHPCTGRVILTIDPTLPARGKGGEARGVTWSGGAWKLISCDISVAPDRQGCETILHEVGHLVHGGEHTGPMSPQALTRAAARVCRPRPTRARLHADILRTLPHTMRWRITCTPTGPRMRCRARARGQADRRFYASITESGMTWGPLQRGT